MGRGENMETELQKRKLLRWRNFDYSKSGAYFITICTHEKRNTLSQIVGAIHESPVPILTEYGKIAETFIKSVPDRFGAMIDQYIIMPNHIHLIISIDNEDDTYADESSRGKRSLLSNIIGFIKMNTSKEIRRRFGETSVWQRGFYDHVIRNQEDYRAIEKYIRENPLCWQMGVMNDW